MNTKRLAEGVERVYEALDDVYETLPDEQREKVLELLPQLDGLRDLLLEIESEEAIDAVVVGEDGEDVESYD